MQMRRALMESGYTVRVFAEGIHPACSAIAESIHGAPRELWQSPENILIYHHSTWWATGEELLFETRNQIVLRYHNITPERFFAPYSVPHTEACHLGIESTRRIAKLPQMLIMGDSTYNCEDLIALGANPDTCRVLPPFHLTEELGREMFDFATLSQYSGATANILFVGGVKPNKGHARAIRVFAEYQRHFNDRSRLIFAGDTDERLDGYVIDLKALASQLDVADHVIFTGKVTEAQIKSLYVCADVFLCMSEHEGFCVPLVESMYFRVPIVAWGVTAVPETLGNCGFVHEEWNEFAFAAHIDRLLEDDQTAERLGTLGRRRYHEVFAPEVLRKQLDGIIAEVP
jgi:glycosyltransferase involved in cell wall biosynthesis